MKKGRMIDKNFLEKERKQWGKGTIVCESWEEFEKYANDYNGGVVSPGGAAGKLGVSRQYINQLEKEGKIRAYRIIVDDKTRKHLPLWLRVFAPTKEVYIFIPSVDVDRIKKEMIKKAEEKVRKLKGGQ